MSILPFCRDYYCGHRLQFPQYAFSGHQQIIESTSSQDSNQIQGPARFYHGLPQDSYPDPYAPFDQNSVATSFTTPNLNGSGKFPNYGSNCSGFRPLNPQAPNFGAHSCGITQSMGINGPRDILWTTYSPDQPCIERYPVPHQQFGMDYHIYGIERGDSTPQIQGNYDGGHIPDQFGLGIFGPNLSTNQGIPKLFAPQTCCSSSHIISSLPNFAPTGMSHHGIPSHSLTSYGQEFYMNTPSTGFFHDTCRVGMPITLPQSCSQFLNTGNFKKTHYNNNNQRNKNSIYSRNGTKNNSPRLLQNKYLKKLKYSKNGLTLLTHEDPVSAPQHKVLQESVISTPMVSSEISVHAKSKREQCEGDIDDKDIEQIPLATQQIPQKEFFSEEEIATPPNLRPRRGKSISSAAHSSDSAIYDKCDSGSSLGIEYSGQPVKMNLNPSTNINSSTQFGIKNSLNIALNPAHNRKSAINQFGSIKKKDILNEINLQHPPNQSFALNALVAMGRRKPSIDEVFNSLPFVEYCRSAKADDFGVIKIKNIPYSVKRSEVIAFLGSNARIISEKDYEPIHIVMERVTSKTLDCYVEFVNFDEALNAVSRFDQGRSGGRNGRLGQRYVEIEISNQQSLMQDLFPKAKNIQWNGAVPTIKPRNPDDNFNSGFRGFISREELIMLVKHVEAPQRSSFAKENPQRPYECLISTLFKYPWYMVDYITIEDRDLLHKATIDLLRLLREYIKTNVECTQLTPTLYKRVWRAAMKCQGFSPSQKDDIAVMVDLPREQVQEFGLPPFASFWKYLWTIGPRPGVPDDLILWYIAQIREATISMDNLTLAEKSAQSDQHNGPELFGSLHKHIDYGDRCEFPNQTMAQVAAAEWTGIEKILRQIFAGSKNS